MSHVEDPELLVINEMISTFKKKFTNTTGKTITIIVDGLIFDENKLTYRTKPTLIELEAIVNEFLPKNAFFHTIRVARRVRYLSDLRKIFSKIARDLGYTWMSIGHYFHQDHTTIINNYNKAESLIQNEPVFANTYFKVLKTLQDDFGINDGDSQAAGEPESALSDAMLS